MLLAILKYIVDYIVVSVGLQYILYKDKEYTVNHTTDNV